MKNIILLFCFLTGSILYGQNDPKPTIAVMGTGTVNVVPDRVVINSRIEHTGNSAAEVKKQNDQVVNDVIKYLKSQGVEAKDIQTEYIRLNKEVDYNTKEIYYSANQAISIQLKDLRKYETVMSGLLKTGLNRIDGVEFKTSQKEQLQAEARQKAVLNAKAKAEEYAEALGQELGKAISMEEVQTDHFQPVYRMEMKADSSSGQQTIAPGEMEVTVKVNISFLLL
ncbi:SIMPL domain-containing protein [Salinimicrobium oceani]|uniref:SIMPL domain-containing protein n=1 Tax=Salinimicrobium oceani TaxID=2722702 RepID=A0ABX1CZQ2_9FLAO|nr:SIMPL domain-containing protein [Salinimicrobium oceani]NJW53475.1 SIMPL domain-containing protein [Salinimicrobium oceani]